MQQLDVSTHRLIMLPRNGAFPADRINQIYSCDPADFTDAVLTRLRSEALAMVEILGGAPPGGGVPAGAVAAATWRISDLSHANFGEVVPPAAIADENVFIRREGAALVRLDNVWTTAALEEAESTGLEPFRRRFVSGPGRDRRLFKETVDSDGRHHRSFLVALSMLHELTASFWPIDGPRTVKEFLLALRGAGYNGLIEYHHDWVRNSSVAEKSAVCREHKFLLDLFRMLMEYDQVDPSSLAGVELLTRRIYQIEIAVDRNPRQPDFEGLDALVETSTKSSGSVNVPSMAKWFSQHQQSEAFVLKQMRLWAEEKTQKDKKK